MQLKNLWLGIITLGLSACGTVISITPPPPPPPSAPITQVTIGMPLSRVQALLGHLPPCRHAQHCWDYVDIHRLPGRPPIEHHYQLHFQQGRLARIEERTRTLPPPPPSTHPSQPVMQHPHPPVPIGMSMAQVQRQLGAPQERKASTWTYIQRPGNAHGRETRHVIHFSQGRVARVETYQAPG